MQIRRSSFAGRSSPCSVDPHHPIHCHGGYLRYANCNDQQRHWIQRFLCRYCGRTISVLPDDVLPHRAVTVPLVQQHFDVQAHRTDVSKSVTTEKEEGCLKRAWVRFQQHAH